MKGIDAGVHVWGRSKQTGTNQLTRGLCCRGECHGSVSVWSFANTQKVLIKRDNILFSRHFAIDSKCLILKSKVMVFLVIFAI